MEKTLERNDFCSAGGWIKSIYYVAAQQIKEITPKEEGVSVKLASSAFWKNMGGLAEATVSGEPQEGGGWKYTLEAKIAGRGAMAPRYLERLTAGRWLVKLTDADGREWLIGEADSALACAVTDTATSEATGETLYSIRLAGIQRQAARVIVS